MSARSVPRSVLTVATVALIGAVVIAEPAVAHSPVQSAAVDAYTLTAARFWATAAALLGVAGAVIGWRSVRQVGADARRNGAVVALVAGLIATVGGALNLAVADGGPGTGNGVVGGAVALVAGLIAVALGWLALARTRGRLNAGA
jgi:hypothetical protein